MINCSAVTRKVDMVSLPGGDRRTQGGKQSSHVAKGFRNRWTKNTLSDGMSSMTELVLGPLLRHVDERTATVWVETSQPCDVSVLGVTTPTFTVHGHHFAIVELENLEPGSETPYEVRLGEVRVWPEEGSAFPASVIRTLGDGVQQVAFGSCRIAPGSTETHKIDALQAYAHALIAGQRPPSVLLMVGDQ